MIEPLFQAPPSDTMWVNNTPIRTDLNITSEEAKPIVDKLLDKFPSFNLYDDVETRIGDQTSYRPPYENYTISMYKFYFPPKEITEVGRINNIRPPYVEFLPWYGLKFDMLKGTMGIKLVFNDLTLTVPRPPRLPHKSRFFAQYYHPDGTPDSTIDSYFFATPNEVQKLCDTYNLPFPCEKQRNDKLIYIGIVYNRDDLTITTIKSYCTFDFSKL